MEPSLPAVMMLQVPVQMSLMQQLRQVSKLQAKPLRAVVQEALEKYLVWYAWQQQGNNKG